MAKVEVQALSGFTQKGIKMATKHTKTPWVLAEDGYHIYSPNRGRKYNIIGEIGHGGGVQISLIDKANAEFIVRAVNSHDDLLTTIQECLAFIENNGPLPSCAKRAARVIAKAKGKSDE